MVITARREEGCAVSESLHYRESEDAGIKPERPLQVGDLQMHVPDADARIGSEGLGWRIGLVGFHRLS
jgi:hypothetical protein